MTLKRFVTEEKISELNPNWKRSSLQVSPDGKHFGFIYLHKKGEFRVKVNHKQSPSFELIEQFQFSPGSESSAYMVKGAAGYQIIWQDQPGPIFNFIGGDSLVFSPDGNKIAYTALESESWKIMVNHEEEISYDNADILQLTFTPKQQEVAAILETIEGVHLEINGMAQSNYGKITDLVFNPANDQAAYIAEKDDNKYLVLEGQEMIMADNIRQPVFSPDGARFAFAYRNGNDWFVKLSDDEFGPYENAAQLTYSPDNQRFAFTCQRGDDYFVVLDGQEQAFFDGVGQAVFSPDSRRMAYSARRTHKKFLQAIDTYFVVVDGEEKKPYSAIGQSGMSFSPDSQRFAYKAQVREMHFVVVDDVESTLYDGIGANTPIFSPDSQHYAFVAQFQKKSAVVLDGHTGEEYSAVVLKGGGKLSFIDENTLQYLGSRKSEIYLVTETIES